MAKEMHGYLFFTEHRFYGQSRPLEIFSTAYLKNLHIDQALEDLAHFISEKKASIAGANNSGVIVVGYSYSATMATWLRQRYADLIQGAWASSGPLFAKVDFYEFAEVVGIAIRKVGGQVCYDRLEQVFEQMETEVKNGIFENIQQQFNLCHDVDLGYQMDVWQFFRTLFDRLTQPVQTYRSGDIEIACHDLTDASIENPIEAFVKWVREGNSSCYDTSYRSFISYLRKVEWDPDHFYRPWYFQTCNEFGWYESSASKRHPFGSNFPLALSIQMCMDAYNGSFSADIIEQNVRATNKQNGGFHPNITNVFTTHGEFDPWRPMGIQEDLNPDAPVVIIKGASHISDMGSISPSDTKQMRETKLRITKFVKKWLGIN